MRAKAAIGFACMAALGYKNDELKQAYHSAVARVSSGSSSDEEEAPSTTEKKKQNNNNNNNNNDEKPKSVVFRKPDTGNERALTAEMGEFKHMIISLVPWRLMSKIWGKMAVITVPTGPLRRALFGLWCHVYGCSEDEMDRPLEDFTCFTDFFTRPLPAGLRVIDPTPTAMVSPVDAKVVSMGNFRLAKGDLDRLNNIEITKVKGINYRFLDFVGQHPQGLDMSRPLIFSYVVLYLAPGDYHRFHSPAEWSATQRRHFPGHLVPLRKRFAGMYQENERVVMNGTWKHGFFSMAAVGALNVGSIHMDCDKEIETNQGEGLFHRRPTERCHEREYEEPVPMTRGEQVGKFSMGSTIVLVFQHSGDFEFDVKTGERVRLGQKIGATEADA